MRRTVLSWGSRNGGANEWGTPVAAGKGSEEGPAKRGQLRELRVCGNEEHGDRRKRCGESGRAVAVEGSVQAVAS